MKQNIMGVNTICGKEGPWTQSTLVTEAVTRGENINWCVTLLYCSENDTKNTMCAYGTEDKDCGNCTGQTDLIQANQSIRSYWLALHNTFRDQVASGNVPGLPAASNMLQLVWDDVLILQARRWAFRCRYEDDPCARSPMYGHLQPETIYNETLLFGDLVTDSRKSVLTRFLQNVIGYRSFPAHLITNMDDKQIHTFEQVNLIVHVFARIREIGAALILYRWREGGSLYPFLKSNTYYGPPIGKGPVYLVGKPCTECPKGYKCNARSTYPHLCAESSDSSSEEYTNGLPGTTNQENGATHHGRSALVVSSIFFTHMSVLNLIDLISL